MVRDTATAEDLAQEVFLRVYRARKQYTPSAKFTTWLFRIATNLALNSVRDNRYQKLEIRSTPRLRRGSKRRYAIAGAGDAHRRENDGAGASGNDPAGGMVAAGKATRGGVAA